MSEYLRAFIGSTELTYSTLEIIESDDYIIDSAKLSVKGVAIVIPGAIVDIRKADGITSIFSGQINNITKTTTWDVEVLGNGYELNNLHIQTVWDNKSPEDIIKDVVDTYTDNLTYTGISSSGTTINRYIGNAYALDIIKDMLDVLGWIMTIDTNNNVNIMPKATINNGIVFTNGDNVNLFTWSEDNNNLANRVRIKGGFESFALTETVTGTATTFAVSKKPQGSMRITVSGTEIDPSDYTINSDDETVTFDSSQTDPTFEYSYNRPVQAEDQDDDSINAYGEIFKEVPAPWLDTTVEARVYAAGLIDAFSTPLKSVTAFRGGLNYDVTVGETVRVIDDIRGYDELMSVRKRVYTGSGSTNYSLGTQTTFFNEWQREVQERIKKIERRFANQDDIIFSRRLKHDMKITLTQSTTCEKASPTNTFWLDHTTLGQMRNVVNGHIENYEADCSSNSNYGTWYGTGINGSQYDSSGERLYCGDFNGSDNYIEGNNVGSLQTGSICAWVYPHVTTSAVIAANIVGANDRLVLGVSTGRFVMNRYDGSNHGRNSSTFTANSWYHVAVTTDGTTQKMYVNGILDNAGTLSASSSQSTNKFRVGVKEDDTSWFNGLIDEVMLFDTELSLTTINEIKNKQFYSNHSEYSDCVLWYSFDNPLLGIRMGARTTI